MKGRVYVLTTENLQWCSILVFDNLAEMEMVQDSIVLSRVPIERKAIRIAWKVFFYNPTKAGLPEEYDAKRFS